MLVATGRMFRSVAPYLETQAIGEPVVCYQGAAVVDPGSGEFLLHVPLALDVAREAIAALAELGLSPNVYVDDELFVARETEYSRAYSVFQHLPVTEVGDLLGWLDRAPTKLVQVADPPVLAEIRPGLERRFDGRMFVTTSLPHLLELGNPSVTKGSGIAFAAGGARDRPRPPGRLRRRRERRRAARRGRVRGRDRAEPPRLLAIADATCAGPEDDGVATVIEAVLDSLA